jgi:hypothetical protein
LLLCQSSLSDGQKDGGVGDKKGVRKWEPRDPLASKERTNEHLRNSLPRSPQSQSTDNNKYGSTNIPDGKGSGKYSTRGVNIKEYFSERPIQQHIVDTFMNEKMSQCGKSEITALFRLLGKKSKYQRHPLLKLHLPAIARRLNLLSVSWIYNDIASIIYGLQQFNLKDDGVLDIILFVNKMKINTERASNAQNVGNALYGLQGMNSECSEIRELLSTLVPKVKSCSEALKAQEVGNALYGLQKMNSEYSEVRDILSALVPKVKSCSEALSTQAVGNALYGLQKMNSEYSEVREILSALVPKVKSCSEALTAQAVGIALY